MRKRSRLPQTVPAAPTYAPVRKAIEQTQKSPEISSVLKFFASMPPSTGVFANPVRHQHQLQCAETTMDVAIRSFTIRGILQEEDIAAGRADAEQSMFVGLFSRMPTSTEDRAFRKTLEDAFAQGLGEPLRKTAEFVRSFPNVSPDTAMQHWTTFRKASTPSGGVHRDRPSGPLLDEMIAVHMENVAVAGIASYARHRFQEDPRATLDTVVRQTRDFIADTGDGSAFTTLFGLLLRRPARPHEVRILGHLGAIQVHHGSAGSNMVARYLSSLHTRSVSDLFTAAQMTLDSGRHFGAISDLTDFVRILEKTPKRKIDAAIRTRILNGNLPTFGHPEIAAAGRDNHLEMDPRPALYLAPLFDAIDAGLVPIDAQMERRGALLQRMYQMAFVEGVEKTTGRLRLTPNTDFGAWLVQETLGIEEHDRTLLSYAYRGFGWMMDVREQLQQPIIRPVIPPDPALTAKPPKTEGDTVPDIISRVHERLATGKALDSR